LNGYATTFGYDNDLVVTSVKYPGSDIVTHTRTALAQTSSTSTSATYEEAIWRGMGYDDLGRITEHMYRDQYEALWSNEFAYDSVGRVAADTAYRWYGTEDCDDHWLGGFYCDEQSGYWGAVYPREEYEYDAVGNRQTAISDYDTTTTNRITAFAGCEYTWDADGNITSRHSCTTSAPNVNFFWTSDNRLWRYKVTSGDTVTVDLRYDGHGRLARKYVHGSLSRRYIWNGETLFAELDASGNKILEYSYYGGLDNLHAVIDGDGEPYFAHKDGMGNVIALTDRLRNVEEQYTYSHIWGGLSLDTLSSCEEADCNRSKYKGALHIGEEAGIYYMRNRWYEPHTGRFLSEDPIGLEGGINLYVYSGNDPVNNTDPTGLRCAEVLKNGVYILECDGGGGGWAEDLRTIADYLGGAAGDAAWKEFASAGWGQYAGGGRPLTACEKQTLAPYIPQEDLDNAIIYDWAPPLFPDFYGVTRGNHIFFKPGAYDPRTSRGIARLGHELVHVGQYRTGMTWVAYLWSCRKGYRNSKYEKQAFALQRWILNDLNKSGFGGCRWP